MIGGYLMETSREEMIINQLAQNFAQKVAALEGEKAILQIELQLVSQELERIKETNNKEA
jgi:hypothetical protein